MPITFVVVLASALAMQLPAPVASDEVRVATSASHTLVIAPDGRVWCQGRNQYGVCGVDQATAFVEKLSPVPDLPKGRAVAIANTWTSMVLGEDGRVYVWGKNDFGLFGGTDHGPTYVRPQPTAVAGLERVIGIAAFEYGGAALRDDGTVWMWGEVWAGGNRVLALKSDGTLYLWGVAGTEDDRVLRVPTMMTTFALSTPREP